MRLDSLLLGLVPGLLCGQGLFVATNWLVIRGGENVGAHLRLLGHFFIGRKLEHDTNLLFRFFRFSQPQRAMYRMLRAMRQRKT